MNKYRINPLWKRIASTLETVHAARPGDGEIWSPGIREKHDPYEPTVNPLSTSWTDVINPQSPSEREDDPGPAYNISDVSVPGQPASDSSKYYLDMYEEMLRGQAFELSPDDENIKSDPLGVLYAAEALFEQLASDDPISKYVSKVADAARASSEQFPSPYVMSPSERERAMKLEKEVSAPSKKNLTREDIEELLEIQPARPEKPSGELSGTSPMQEAAVSHEDLRGILGDLMTYEPSRVEQAVASLKQLMSSNKVLGKDPGLSSAVDKFEKAESPSDKIVSARGLVEAVGGMMRTLESEQKRIEKEENKTERRRVREEQTRDEEGWPSLDEDKDQKRVIPEAKQFSQDVVRNTEAVRMPSKERLAHIETAEQADALVPLYMEVLGEGSSRRVTDIAESMNSQDVYDGDYEPKGSGFRTKLFDPVGKHRDAYLDMYMITMALNDLEYLVNKFGEEMKSVKRAKKLQETTTEEVNSLIPQDQLKKLEDMGADISVYKTTGPREESAQ